MITGHAEIISENLNHDQNSKSHAMIGEPGKYVYSDYIDAKQ